MPISRRGLLATAATALPLARARAAAGQTIKIGVLNDQSGPYRDTGGMTSVYCTRQAVQDFGDKGFPVEVVFADHQNKPDVGAAIARQWFDQDGVDMIVDVPTSSVALAVNAVVREKNKVFVDSGAATTDLTGKQCSPNTIHWTYDTYMLARSTGGATVRAGGDTWFFLTADYVFGHQLQRDATRFITASGGSVMGSATYPFPGTSDFSSFLLQAQASGAKVLGLANAGGDTVNAIKQAGEFGLTGKMQIAALLMFLSDVHGLGLEAAKGLRLTESFYWDLNDRTRAFTSRVRSKTPENWPNMDHAGCYAGTLHFLKAVADIGVAAAKASGRDVVARMKAMPTDDDAFGTGSIRIDGRGLHPAYLFQVKRPEESHGPFDYYNLIATTPADQAWRPLSEGGCALVHA
jgi:branched-chain amino acid transport system substrate-binding protein